MPLTSLRLLLVLGAAAAVVLGATWWHLSRSRHRVLRATTGSVVALVLVVGTVGVGVNRHFDLYRSWGDVLGPHSADIVEAGTRASLARALATRPRQAAAPLRGTLLSVQIPATVSRLDVMGAYVYLPKQYDTPAFAHRDFPVVEAFNGSPGVPANWITGVLADQSLDHAIASGKVAPAIVVFPPTNTSFLRSLECTDTRDGLRDETFLTTDVRSWVLAHLRTASARWTTIGFSTGGYCALDLAVRHPDLYFQAVSLDGYGRALSDGFARGLWRNAADRLVHSPNWVFQHEPPRPVDVYLLAGSDDPGARYDASLTWRALLAGGWMRPRDQLVNEPGGRHSFDAWQRAFVPALEWALPGPGGQVLEAARKTAPSTQTQSAGGVRWTTEQVTPG